MALLYPSLLSNIPLKVCETATEYKFLTERHLQAMWFEQKYFKNLTTVSGEPIEILSPGIWNAEAGPDFLKAHIRIGTKEYRGDIEMHFADESWYHHQHHLDARYDNVVLHISLWLPIKPKPVTTHNGQAIIQTYLENRLTLSHARIVQLIDLDLYPYKKFTGSGRCAKTLFRTLPEEKISTFFKNASEWRLLQKASYLESHVESPDTQLGAGFSMALGYKNNAETFFNLFLWLSRFHFTHEEDYLAAGLKACGYFEESFQKKWQESKHYSQLLDRSKNLSLFEIPKFKLALNQIRPLNSPIRRLVYLSKFLALNTSNLYNQFIQLWNDKWMMQKTKKDWNKLQDDFWSLIPSYVDTYWNHHFSFELDAREEFLPLIGEDLKKEMTINTVLPLLYKHIQNQGNPREQIAFDEFYATFAASKTGKTRYLTHRFFGESSKGSVFNKAFAEQGAYQLHHDFCVHFEASCEGCPFEERYKNTF